MVVSKAGEEMHVCGVGQWASVEEAEQIVSTGMLREYIESYVEVALLSAQQLQILSSLSQFGSQVPAAFKLAIVFVHCNNSPGASGRFIFRCSANTKPILHEQ
jgi:hypothetical protein